MKILHTADWHLGKRLYNQDLSTQHKQFLEWLLNLVDEEKIQMLLIAGDVFDLAHPSLESQRMYYDFLEAVARRGVKVVISSGNHDSPSFLQAPAQILRNLDVYISARWTEAPQDVIIDLSDHEDKVVVAALPFLRDADLRRMVDLDNYADRLRLQRDGVKKIMDDLDEYITTTYPEHHSILMAHDHFQGVQTSDSERDLTIGTLQGLPADLVNTSWTYTALGHIHRPQRIGKRENVRYSGSPIPLSFSEREDDKQVILLEISDSIERRVIQVPRFIKLRSIKGDFNKIETQLDLVASDVKDIPVWVELQMIEDEYRESGRLELEQLVTNFQSLKVEIINWSIHYKQSLKSIDHLFVSGESLEALSPQEVFSKRLNEDESLKDSDREELNSAFHTLLQETSFVGDAD